MTDSIQTETREHAGHTITVKWFINKDCPLPWDYSDGHGPVREDYASNKKPGELVMAPTGTRDVYYLYDFAEACRIARRESWCGPAWKDDGAPLFPNDTPKQKAMRAAMADFCHLKSWCDGEWYWVGYTVTIDGFAYIDDLWDIDSLSMDEYTEIPFRKAITWLDRELVNRFDAACADILTV